MAGLADHRPADLPTGCRTLDATTVSDGPWGRTIGIVALVDSLPYEPWRDPNAVVAGEFRWRLGVRPLDEAAWFEFGPDADGPDGWLAEKERVLAEHHDRVVVAVDDSMSECVEVADAIVDHLARHHPERPRTLMPGQHRLEAASRLVPEDLVVMVERGGRLVFGAASVCFPNRWDLPSKLGLTMSEVHAPVARLDDQLGSNIDRFLDKLEVGRSFTRLGWGVIDVPDGFAPPGPGRADAVAFDDRFVRVERETLRRLPRTRCVLFTIRTHVAPVARVRTDRESYAALRTAVDAMPIDIAGYKDLVDVSM